ncbi:VanW family protein [Lysinibacillus sp. NPDC097287]|uniref:VanW family protein n=1 Tax=Lysinibacillus sp. NPDC097287 TaxID=3364144 RepID=UPI00382F77FD
MGRRLKIMTLLTIIAILTAMWIPNIVLNSTTFAKEVSKASTIGGVEVADLKVEEIEAAVQAAVTEWLATPVMVTGDGMTSTIDPSQFVFDVASSVAEYERMTDKSWYAFWEGDQTVHIPLKVLLNEEVQAQLQAVGDWDVENTLNSVVGQASYLKEHEVEATVVDTTLLEAERLALAIEEIPVNTLGIVEVGTILNDFVIAPGENISLLTILGENTELANQDGLDFVASMLYNAVLQTDYEILERHAQNEKPSYLQQGTEASINQTLEKDLQFVNLSEQPGKIKVTTEGKSLKVEIFSQTKEKDIKIRVDKDRIVDPRIIYRYSDELAVGQEKTVQEGKEGIRVEVYRSIVENGVSSEVLVSRDYYAPVNRIVVRSTKQHVTATGGSETNPPSTNSKDPDLQLDLDGNGLADTPSEPGETSTNNANKEQSNNPDIVYGYYDKGGNFVQTSP